jgi:very-short-patch-repair endonuclease
MQDMPLSQTEALARALLKHYLPRERFLYNVRPDWLRNPKTGKRLELDLYCPERSFAIEIDGVQHGRYIKGMQRDFRAFTDQQARDMHKLEVCNARGITLYKLTIFDLIQPRFAPFLVQLCITHGMKIERYIEAPHHLFDQAEKLSRAKVVKRTYRKPGILPMLQRFRHRLFLKSS